MAGVAIAAGFVTPGVAQPKMSTSYSYYSVSGGSLAEIHRSIVSQGPMLNGTRSYGITMASPGKQMSVASCKASGRYRLAVNISIKLPRIASSGQLSAAEVGQWNRFSSFVRKHEEKHRAIWGSCAADYERKFMAGETGNCENAHSRAMSLWHQMVASCMPRQIAFDAAQRNALKSHPFMKYASR